MPKFQAISRREGKATSNPIGMCSAFSFSSLLMFSLMNDTPILQRQRWQVLILNVKTTQKSVAFILPFFLFPYLSRTCSDEFSTISMRSHTPMCWLSGREHRISSRLPMTRPWADCWRSTLGLMGIAESLLHWGPAREPPRLCHKPICWSLHLPLNSASILWNPHVP